VYPFAEIIGFEPDKDIFAVLQKNISNRKYNDITLINKGLWNQDGKMQFVGDGADGGNIIPTEHPNSSASSEVTEIETTTLKEYLNRKVDFLKIDIEGAESIVIEDCQNLLHNVDHIFIEYHSQENVSQRLEVILSVLAKEGFRYYIESAIQKSKLPFIKREKLNNIDNFLNIYAYKEAK
jgi:FkbM family methyltransferase